MSRERKVGDEASAEDVGINLRREFEVVKLGIYEAWHESERGNITPTERTSRIKEIYRLHPNVVDDFEEPTEEIVGDKFLTVGQLVAKIAKEDVIAERDRARRVREEASRASAGQKRYARRTKAQDRRGTNARDIH